MSLAVQRPPAAAGPSFSWRRWAPFLLLGPVSGPLLAGVIFHLRAGRPVLAGLYAMALLEFFILLPWATAQLGARLL